eukprot:scaffold82260_cov75-Phaeocystis_antarctica.AAC.1
MGIPSHLRRCSRENLPCEISPTTEESLHNRLPFRRTHTQSSEPALREQSVEAGNGFPHVCVCTDTYASGPPYC